MLQQTIGCRAARGTAGPTPEPGRLRGPPGPARRAPRPQTTCPLRSNSCSPTSRSWTVSSRTPASIRSWTSGRRVCAWAEATTRQPTRSSCPELPRGSDRCRRGHWYSVRTRRPPGAAFRARLGAIHNVSTTTMRVRMLWPRTQPGLSGHRPDGDGLTSVRRLEHDPPVGCGGGLFVSRAQAAGEAVCVEQRPQLVFGTGTRVPTVATSNTVPEVGRTTRRPCRASDRLVRRHGPQRRRRWACLIAGVSESWKWDRLRAT